MANASWFDVRRTEHEMRMEVSTRNGNMLGEFSKPNLLFSVEVCEPPNSTEHNDIANQNKNACGRLNLQ